MQIVHKVEDGMDRKDILCTTYQMRNFYEQLGDGFFTVLDVMNYIQHQTVVRMARDDETILDMCCGRGLLLPMLRYEKKTIRSYTGVDIEPANVTFRTRRVTDGAAVAKGYYPFAVHFVKSNVAEMSSTLPLNYFSLVVYTSSIEHMHPDMGLKSLYEARAVAKPGARMFLTCPNTPENQDGYDTQYAAHVYEWKRSEIEAGLKESGWELDDVYGLLIDGNTLREKLRKTNPSLWAAFQRQAQYVPREWMNPLYALLFPEDAKELAYVAHAV